MSTISIIALIISFLTLIFSYYRFIRNSPRLEIIRLYKSSTSDLDSFIDGLEFSYNGKVYPELSAFEFIVANKSHRSIESEDVISDSPIEIFIDSPSIIHDFRVIKKVGESRVVLNKVDENTIRLDISSMDKGSSLRVKMLCSGEDIKIKARGKLLKANHSVSKIRDLKGVSIPELIRGLLGGMKPLFIGSVIIGLIIGLFATYVEFDTTPANAKILAPDSYHSLYGQFHLLDSLQESRNAKRMYLIHESMNGSLDSFNLDLVTAHWSMRWWGDGDSVATRIADSLMNEGYQVEYAHRHFDFYTKDGYEIDKNFTYPAYKLLVKEHDTDYLLSLLTMFFLIFVGTVIIVFLMITSLNSKSIYRAFKYKGFLSEIEVKELKEEFKSRFIPRLLTKFL